MTAACKIPAIVILLFGGPIATSTDNSDIYPTALRSGCGNKIGAGSFDDGTIVKTKMISSINENKIDGCPKFLLIWMPMFD